MTKEWILFVLQLGCSFALGAGYAALRRRWDKMLALERELRNEIADHNARVDCALQKLEEGNLAAARRALLVPHNERLH